VQQTTTLEGTLRAALTPAMTPRRWRRFLDGGGDASRIGTTGAAVLGDRLGMGRAEATALARALARADPAREFREASDAGVAIEEACSEGYPACLRDLDDPPIVLFVRGTLLASDRNAVALVGSRAASAYGRRVARAFATDLARSGVTVVGGLARGIDAEAHESALRAGGRTIAVLGSGLLEPYPPEHVELLERIASQGAVVSEFPLHAPPARPNFPRRNRIIAALGLGTVVVESAEKGGALSTVRHALDLGRPVMAVPGPVDSQTSLGTLRMLRDGAEPVGSAADVFAALGWCALGNVDLPEDERLVLDSLPESGGTSEEVAAATGMAVEVAAGHLVTLEVRGLVERREGGRYVAR
jgi:DNA processing protein